MAKVDSMDLEQIAQVLAYGLVTRCFCSNRHDASVAHKRSPYRHILRAYYDFLMEYQDMESVIILVSRQSVAEARQKYGILGYDAYTWKEMATIITHEARLDRSKAEVKRRKIEDDMANALINTVLREGKTQKD